MDKEASGKITMHWSYALVGQFMKEWSLVELATNRVLSGALQLNNSQSRIICKTLRFRTKFILIRKMTKSLPQYGNSREHFDTIINTLRDLNDDRNMVAHNEFHPSDDEKCVNFYEISTDRTDLGYVLKDSWDTDNFLDRFSRMRNLTNSLETLRRQLRQSDSHLTLAEIMTSARFNILLMEPDSEDIDS